MPCCKVSKAMAEITTVAFGFLENTTSKICSIAPQEPPIKTWVGAGSSNKDSGAVPRMVVIWSQPNCTWFSFVSATASSFWSMAYTWPLKHCNAISTETEPVPQPTSQQTAFCVTSNIEIALQRISRFVIGTFPRIQRSSGIPTGIWVSAQGFSTTITASGAVSNAVYSDAIPA